MIRLMHCDGLKNAMCIRHTYLEWYSIREVTVTYCIVEWFNLLCCGRYLSILRRFMSQMTASLRSDWIKTASDF